MKIKTIIYTIIFSLVIVLISLLPSKVNAAITLDRVLNIDGTDLVPVIGQTPGAISDSEYYEVVSQIWREENGTLMTGNFEEGKSYTYEVTIKQKDGYQFSDDVYFNFSDIEWIENGHGVSNSEGIAFFTGKCKTVKTHKLTINSDDGVITIPNGVVDIYTGYTKEVTILPKEGYVLESVKVNGIEKLYTSDMTGNEKGEDVLNVTCEDEDINVVIKTQKCIKKVEVTGAVVPKVGNVPEIAGLKVPDAATYKIIEATWGTYDGQMGPIDTFKELKNGEKFAEGKYYTLKVKLESLDEKVFWGDTEGIINNRISPGVGENKQREFYLTFDILKSNYFLSNTDNQKFTLGTDKVLKFHLDVIPLGIVENEIYVDGEKIKNTDYIFDFDIKTFNPDIDKTSEISLKEEYIKTLKSGKHTIKFVFFDGIEAETEFTIINNTKPEEDTVKNNIINNTTNENKINNENKNNLIDVPQTGDNIIPFIGLLLISIAGMAIIVKIREYNK